MNEQPIVTLTHTELFFAAQVGVCWTMQAIKRGHGSTYGIGKDEQWERAIQGAIGEMVVAKHFGIYWTGNVGIVGAPDVGEIEVRTTQHQPGHLIIHKRDDDKKTFVLVTGKPPSFRLAGWQFATVAKQEKYWKELQPGRPAFCVPENKLCPIATIPIERNVVDVKKEIQTREPSDPATA